MLSGEATNTNLIVFGFTRSGLEPTIYHTQGEPANHYTTNEPTIYRTQGEPVNHYTTDAVSHKNKNEFHWNIFGIKPQCRCLGLHASKRGHCLFYWYRHFMVFNATFNNISVISWRSVLLVDETRVSGDNHRSNWQTLWHNVVLSIPRHERDLNSQR